MNELGSFSGDVKFSNSLFSGWEMKAGLSGGRVNNVGSVSVRRNRWCLGRRKWKEGGRRKLSKTTNRSTVGSKRGIAISSFVSRNTGMGFNFAESDMGFRSKERVVVK